MFKAAFKDIAEVIQYKSQNTVRLSLKVQSLK